MQGKKWASFGGRERKPTQHFHEELKKLGGVKEYQLASKRGEKRTHNFDTSKWVKELLEKYSIEPSHPGTRLNLLDVGALDLNYRKEVKWIECTPIDLHPHKTGIMKRDFLSMNATVDGSFDVIVLSLVLNFEGDAEKRGKMLQIAGDLLHSSSGHLFVVLPKACITKSRYLTDAHFRSILQAIGFELVTQHFSRKLALYMFKKCAPDTKNTRLPPIHKSLLRSGSSRNNFSITLSQ
eukprot:m.10433 g.10433  ORF g.10433 m.10433 type:complete len:237 (+) comp22294_c0_seq2:145-855(+)